MQTLIYKKPIFGFPRHVPSYNPQTHKNRDFLRIHPKRCHHHCTLKTPTLCSATSPQSLSYGGWGDFQLIGDSDQSGESNQFHNFLSSSGIGDKKYVFLYLFGFVCALAISRVKVSTIMVFPASAIVFAIGFSVGWVKGGHLKESRLNENKRKLIEDTFRDLIEKLGNLEENLGGYKAEIVNVKNSIRRSIECNQVTVSDLEGYIDVIESADVSFQNSLDVVQSCIQSIVLDGDESGRKRKKSGENGFSFSQYFNGLIGGKFDGPKHGKKEQVSAKKELMDVEANILASAVKERNPNAATNRYSENENTSMSSDSPFDSTVRAQNRVEDFANEFGTENISLENETDDLAKAAFDQTMYSYQNKSKRLVNEQAYLEDFEDEMETVSSHNDSYSSVDVSISMNRIKTAASFGHQQKRETPIRNYLHIEKREESQQESRRFIHKKGTSTPEKRPSFATQEFGHENNLSNDLEFNSCLAEAKNLFKEAKGFLTQKVDDDDRAEHALHKSATLLSKAIDMRPMSLLAVGQLGNTYLLHGELKLRRSRNLRSLLVRTDDLDRFDDQHANKDKISLSLVDVCEECEELLMKAGRKYKSALSIDANDMRALYNWGLALSFRAQLISDIGPSAARDADKVFLAAIDKFDAMMSKTNVYAPDALFRWGSALQHRSRLRPSRSREKVKLLQQARRLYEDALNMDSGNIQLQEALSSCVSELRYIM